MFCIQSRDHVNLFVVPTCYNDVKVNFYNVDSFSFKQTCIVNTAGEPPASVGEVTQPPTGAPAVDRYVTHQKHQYQHLYQHHTTQSFCPQDREGRINGGRNYYLSKSFSTLLLIFSFCNITQLIITPYSNTNVFGSWGTNTTLLGAHHWHSVGIG